MKQKLFIFLIASSLSLQADLLSLHWQQLSPSLMKKLVTLFKTDVLIETGTWGGNTASNGSDLFKEVYTVELSHHLYTQAKNRYRHLSNVHFHEGHSPTFLQNIIPTIEGKMLFWLDAHWCGDGTGRMGKNTPILDELLTIKQSGIRDAVILIDDIRCFQNLPEDTRDGYGGYPPLQEVKKQLLEINPNYAFWVLGDMAIAYPNEPQVEVSILVQACTASRLFEPDKDNWQEVLSAEKIFIDHCYEIDAQEIDALQRLVIPSTEFITTHLILWEGLLELGRKNYEAATRYFETVIKNGPPHWRFLWYLSLAQIGLGQTEKAKESLGYVLKTEPSFNDAKNKLTELQ